MSEKAFGDAIGIRVTGWFVGRMDCEDISAEQCDRIMDAILTAVEGEGCGFAGTWQYPYRVPDDDIDSTAPDVVIAGVESSVQLLRRAGR